MSYRDGLPPELMVHIVTYAPPSSIVLLEQLSKSWNQLIRDADTICWRHHALSYTSGAELKREKGKLNLTTYINLLKDRSLNQHYWDGIHTWKEACLRQKALQDNWSMSSSPKTQTEILGFWKVDPTQSALPIPKLRSLTSSRMLHVPYASQESSYVWRARLDTARDANFIITTWHTGGVRVVDAIPGSSGGVLWELPRWSVRPYAHLEYKRGIACWDGEEGIEVWKRWKIMLGQEGEDEPPNKRGQFVKVAVLPEVENTRGFMLNDDLHLTICSSDGKSLTYDLSTKKPELLHTYDIAMTPSNGPAGHLEHDSDIAVYSMGQKGYSIYQKDSGTLLGNLDFSQQSSTLTSTLEEYKDTNLFKIDSGARYPDLVSEQSGGSKLQASGSKAAASKQSPRREFVTVHLESGGLGERGPSGQHNPTDVYDFFLRTMGGERPASVGKRTNGIPLHYDLWGAAMIRELEDGGTILIARSRGGRILICTDLLGLLASLEGGDEEAASYKIRESVAMIECGGRATRTEVSTQWSSNETFLPFLTLPLFQFYTGGWLTASQNGRVAWEIDDLVYIIQLPKRRNTLPTVGTPIWMIPSHYNDEIPMPDMQIP